jgi:uncharacterized protein (TIGR02246 family)
LRRVFKVRYGPSMSQLSAEDRQAVADVLARYCRTIDQGRWDEFRTLFTDDCRLDFGERMGVHDGTAGVKKFTEMLAATPMLMRHYTMNVTITGDGARAHAESHLLALTGKPGSMIPTTGFYEDELVKRDGRWLLHSRRALLDI